MVAILAITCIKADDTAGELAMAGVGEFNAAYAEWGEGRFEKASDLFRQACALDAGNGLYHYWLGATEFHRMLQYQIRPDGSADRAAAAASMKAATEALLQAVDRDPSDAESHALLGTLYGMRIDSNLLRALQLGPKVQRHRALALRHGPNNPRVRYLLGVAQFHTARKPTALREALSSLRLAERLYQEEGMDDAAPLTPRWGYSSCLTFIGRTQEALGESRAAAEYYARALVLQPADHVAAEGAARVGSTSH